MCKPGRHRGPGGAKASKKVGGHNGLQRLNWLEVVAEARAAEKAAALPVSVLPHLPQHREKRSPKVRGADVVPDPPEQPAEQRRPLCECCKRGKGFRRCALRASAVAELSAREEPADSLVAPDAVDDKDSLVAPE